MTLYPYRWQALLLRLCSPTCGCPSPGKSPHVEGNAWQQRALARYSQADSTALTAHRDAVGRHYGAGGNVGLAIPPHVVALDVDASPEAVEAARITFDTHPIQRTASGVHVWARLPERQLYGTHYGHIPVTVRHVGNQVVVAPSMHRTGFRYEWESELPDDPMGLPLLDVREVRHVAATASTTLQRSDTEDDIAWRERVSRAWLAEIADPAVIFPPGRRHNALLYLAWHLVRLGADDGELAEVLHDFAIHRCEGHDPSHRATRRELADLTRDARRLHESRQATP